MSPLLLLACAGLASPPAARDAGPPSLAPEGFWEHWGDGRAELAGYRLTQARYGELRPGEAVLITVTETFTDAQRVKSDGGHPDEYPVLKLNEVRDFPTGIYDYNVMTSTFLPLDGRAPRGLPVKLSLTMQEWCGHVYDQLLFDVLSAGSRARRSAHSYFDGEADRVEAVDLPPGTVVADALPLLVRGLAGPLLAPGETAQRPLLPRLQDLRMHHQELTLPVASLARGADPTWVEVPAGRFQVETWTVEVEGLRTTFEVGVEAPHPLVAWRRSDGEVGELTGLVRDRYWQQQRTGQEALRAGLGLPARAWP